MDLNERQVRECAYFIWEGEGRVFGRAEAHWLQAEAELRSRVALSVEAAAIVVPSPAKVLKPRASRAKAPAKVAVAEVAPAPVKSVSKTSAPKSPAAGTTAAAKPPAKAPASKAAASKAKPRTPRADAALGLALH